MADLLLGPMQRGLGGDSIRIWVETDGPCTVEVLDHRARTFCVDGHHYAIVELDRLSPGADVAYDVRLDGELVWPRPDDERPPPRVHTWDGERPITLALGSCRQAAPPSWLDPVESERRAPGIGTDALAALARQLATATHRPIDGLIMLGDQVYADEPDPRTIDALRRRRGGPPQEGWPEVAGFEEYTWLYQEAWSEPLIRWLLASVPSVMIFDDHDVIDDWNTSAEWRRWVEAQPWWTGRIEGGLMTYWIYQHLGNVGTTERQDDELWQDVCAHREDGGEALRDFARRADAGTPDDVGHRWSFTCQLGETRLLVVDSRNGRQLAGDQRSMLGPAEWSWLEQQMTGDLDHLLVATSVPWLLPRAIHDLEAWDDQLAGGVWGRPGRWLGERLRQAIDLEHWAAFGRSFHGLADLVTDVANGRRGEPPATVTILSGDVHFGYVAEAEVDGPSRVRQVVSSPFRQAIPVLERRVQRLTMTPPLRWLARALVLTTPRARTDLRWTIGAGPWFDDQLALLELDDRNATLTVEAATLDRDERPVLRVVHQREL